MHATFVIFQLTEDEFTEAEKLAELDIAYNQLKTLNGSLRSLKSLRYLNLTHNFMTEFSLQEIKGLKRLSVIDLSYNKISLITGNMEVCTQNLFIQRLLRTSKNINWNFLILELSRSRNARFRITTGS